MDYCLYKSRHPDHILLYIEEYNKYDNTIVVDFFDSNEYETFFRIIELPMPIDEKSSTMFCLVNYKKRKVQENTIYSVKPSVIKKWKESFTSEERNDKSFLFTYNINSEDIEEEIFSLPISLGDYYGNYCTNDNRLLDSFFQLKGDISVTVRNVGQGNWNEIKSDFNVVIVYDCGASMHFLKEDVIKLLENRLLVYQESKPVLFLSHWDKDHYHCLIGMSESEIKKSFSHFVCRDFLPNNTCINLFNKINSALGSTNVFAIAAEDRSARRGLVRLTNMNKLTDSVVLFNAQKHKNRNMSGLLMLVQSKNKSVILSGDAHYYQLSSDILVNLKTSNSHILVVPHHGGKAGKFIYNKLLAARLDVAVISVGRNSYGHPINKYVEELKKVGFNVQQTNIKNKDITINL